jgi:transposase
MRQSDWVVPDETGWRVGGHPAWLHALVAPEVTAYVIDPTRSGTVAEAILGLDYGGTMIHDGWSPCDQFNDARHRQCLNHLLRRADEMEEAATRGAVCFPRRVAELLRAGLDLRDRHAAGEISRHGLAVACGRLENQLSDLIFPPKTNAANERLAQHLWAHATICSCSCVSRGWTPPTGVRRWRFASALSCERSGEAAAPGQVRGRSRS